MLKAMEGRRERYRQVEAGAEKRGDLSRELPEPEFPAKRLNQILRFERYLRPILQRTKQRGLSVLLERSRKFHSLGIHFAVDVAVPTPATWEPAKGCPGGALHAEPGALHGTVRSRARNHSEQAAACDRHPRDFYGDSPSSLPEVDLGGRLFSWRVGALVSRTPDGRKSSGVFTGTDLFARWANLGRSGSLGVSHGNTPQADLRGYPAKLRLELSTAGSTSAKPRTLRNEGGLYERRKRQFCR